MSSYIPTSLKETDPVPGHETLGVIMIFHRSASIDLEHNVASQQTNVAIFYTVSSQPSACSTQRIPPPCQHNASDDHFIINAIPKPNYLE